MEVLCNMVTFLLFARFSQSKPYTAPYRSPFPKPRHTAKFPRIAWQTPLAYGSISSQPADK